MDPKQIVDAIFSVDMSIRYVGLVGPGPDYDIKASRTREGVESLTPRDKDREFIQVVPKIILGMTERLEDNLGKIRYSMLCFQKLTLVFFETPEYVIVMSLEAGTYVKPIFERVKSLLSLEQ